MAEIHTHDANGEMLVRPIEFAGMSLRDYFAGQALAGLLANNETSNAAGLTSAQAYIFADAMLAARKKET
jgi:hypothetical protein